MAKRSRAEGFFYLARGTAEADRQTALKNRRRPRSMASTAPQYFVPCFAIRRRVLHTPEIEEFAAELRSHLPRNYRVFNPRNLALTIVEQRRLIERFRQADAHPAPEVIENVANKTAKELKRALHGIPRSLIVPTGRVDRFGDDGNNKTKIGIIPRGWKGFAAPYAERGARKEVLPLPVIVRETDLALGGLVTAFAGNESLEQGIRMDGFARTPHISIARKEKGGPISQSEMQSLSTAVEEIMPDYLELFDPMIHLRLHPDQRDIIDISARSPRLSQYAHLL